MKGVTTLGSRTAETRTGTPRRPSRIAWSVAAFYCHHRHQRCRGVQVPVRQMEGWRPAWRRGRRLRQLGIRGRTSLSASEMAYQSRTAAARGHARRHAQRNQGDTEMSSFPDAGHELENKQVTQEELQRLVTLLRGGSSSQATRLTCEGRQQRPASCTASSQSACPDGMCAK